MNKFLLALIGLISFSFADVHPGLKNAIDKGDVKTAETLVKKIGVKDIYCPKNLSVSDAYKIYGEVFENAPEKIWKFCDSAFIANVSSNACKRSASLCKYLLQQEKTENWTPYLKDVLQSKIYQKSEKRIVQKDSLVKATKQECLQNLVTEKARTMEDLTILEKMYCQENDYASKYLCPIYYAAILDSANKYFDQKENQCKKKPTKTIKKDVEESAVVNTFSRVIKAYGLSLAKEMMNPFYFDKEKLELYKSLNQFLTNNEIENYILVTDFINAHTNEVEFNREKFMGEFASVCLAYPKFWTVLSSSQKWKEKGPVKIWADPCERKGYAPYIDTLLLYFFKTKEYAYKELIPIYAEKGVIPDSLTAFFCRLHPEIDKDLKKITDVDIIDCSVLEQYENLYNKCQSIDEGFLWKSSQGHTYSCKNKKITEASIEEKNAGGICTRKNIGEIANGYICDGTWRRSSKEESMLGKSCTIKNNNSQYQDYICTASKGWSLVLKDKRNNKTYKTIQIGDQIWMAENLNYETPESKCYENKKENCAKYGRLYTKNEAKKSCPTNWHLPSSNEWKRLISHVGFTDSLIAVGYKKWMKVKNPYGFSAVPAGKYEEQEDGTKKFTGLNTSIYFLHSSYSDRDFVINLGGNSNSYHENNKNVKENRYSVRCVKD